jgi:lysozyme
LYVTFVKKEHQNICMYKKQIAKPNNKIVYSIIAFLLFLAFSFYIKYKFFKPVFKHYTEFGIDMPTNYSIHGIDVSRYQDDIDWALVKAMKVKGIGIEFAFIKATEGNSYVDPMLEDNMEGTKENGILRGAYHYFIAAKSGKEQAANFIKHANLKSGDLAPVLDIEQNTGTTAAQLHTRLAEWLDVVEKAYNTKPIIYCNIEYYEKYIADKFSGYPIWIAHYKAKDKPRIKDSWAIWQHNEHGHVTGIREDVDFNVFNGGSWALSGLLIK